MTLTVGIGAIFVLLGLALLQAATACALVEIDAGRAMGPIRAYRVALSKVRPLLGGLGFAVVVCLILGVTTFLIPVAVWLAGRWLLLAQAVELEGTSAIGGIRRSSALVRGRWFRVASLVGAGALLALALGPVLGATLILLTDAPLPLVDIVAGVVYALAMPLVALTSSYVYFDARVREELERDHPSPVLPAEIALHS